MLGRHLRLHEEYSPDLLFSKKVSWVMCDFLGAPPEDELLKCFKLDKLKQNYFVENGLDFSVRACFLGTVQWLVLKFHVARI